LRPGRGVYSVITVLGGSVYRAPWRPRGPVRRGGVPVRIRGPIGDQARRLAELAGCAVAEILVVTFRGRIRALAFVRGLGTLNAPANLEILLARLVGALSEAGPGCGAGVEPPSRVVVKRGRRPERVLMSGNMADPHVELIASEIAALGGSVDLLDESTLPYALRIQCGEDERGFRRHRLRYRNKLLNPDLYGGAYFRHIDAASWLLPAALKGMAREAFTLAWIALLRSVFEQDVARFINPFHASVSNFYKPVQLEVLERVGFAIPRTLVTNEPEAVRQFLERCGNKVVVKSASGIRSRVRAFGEDDRRRLHLLGNSPSLFQEQIQGLNIRVHCVGSRLFAAAILSRALDYRYGGDARMRPVNLPGCIERKCHAVTRELGLRLSGIDLIRSVQGEYYALEVNPDPGFLFFQRLSGQRISRAVGEYLMGLDDGALAGVVGVGRPPPAP